MLAYANQRLAYAISETVMEKQKDMEIVNLMIAMYCRGKHHGKKGELCDDCKALADYVALRREKCPFGDDKPFCSNCKIHCYKPDMRAKISAVMRYSGPRLMFSHPIIAMSHVTETIKTKRADKKAAAKAAKAAKGEQSGGGENK